MRLGSRIPTHQKPCPICVPRDNAAPPHWSERPRWPAFGSRAGQINTPLLILFLAGMGLSVAVRSTISSIVSLQNRVNTLERTVEACCSTTYGMYPEEQAAHRAYVELKRRVAELEKKLKELEEER